MNKAPIALTDAEIKEIALTWYEDEDYVFDSVAEAEDQIRDWWAFKIEDYITDGPGYSGNLYVVVTGVESTMLLKRNGDGKLEFLRD